MLYPISTESRQLISLDGIWNFKIDKGNGLNDKWFERKLEEILLKKYKQWNIIKT